MSWILGAVGLVEGFGGGELGSCGVKGEGGIARLEERKGVEGIVSVERMFFVCVGSIDRFLSLRCQGSVLIGSLIKTKTCSVFRLVRIVEYADAMNVDSHSG